MSDAVPLPIDYISERCCVGAALCRTSCLLDLMEIATEEMFYEEKSRCVFKAVKHCFKNKLPVNEVSVAQAFELLFPSSELWKHGYSFDAYKEEGRCAYAKLQLPYLIANHQKHQLLKLASYNMIHAADKCCDTKELLLHNKKRISALSQDSSIEFYSGKEIIEEMFDGVSLLDAIHGNKPVMQGYSTLKATFVKD